MKEHKFLKQYRITKTEDYNNVFSFGNRIVGPYFTLIIKKNDSNHSRFGVIVGKKSVKKAVKRNKIKRLARESFRLHRSELKNVDIVFIGRKKIAQLESKELRRELDSKWENL